MSLTATIKSIQNEMRKDDGVGGDDQRIEQLAWMLFLKVYDAKEAEWEFTVPGYKSPVPEELKWRNWAADPEGMTGQALLDFVNNTLFPGLQNLAIGRQDGRARIVREVFEGGYNFMRSGQQLRKVINKLEEIDFNSLKERQHFGDIYEKILGDLQTAGNAGEFYTPRAVTQFMADRIDPKPGEVLIDPACGTGGFLTCAINHMRKQHVKGDLNKERALQSGLRGVEKKHMPHLLCTTNLLLHDIEDPSFVRHDNTLARPYTSWGKDERVDIVITNPPFGGKETDGIEANFPKAYQTRETADLFLALIIRLLKPGGRCAIVLPDGTLFGEGVKTRLKEALLNECDLHTIVRLPNGVFAPYTGIRTNLLFFTKGKPTKEIWYYEHPYPPGVKSYNKTKPVRFEEFEPEREWWENREENEQAWKIDIRQIIDEARIKAQPRWDAAEKATNEAKALRLSISKTQSALREIPKPPKVRLKNLSENLKSLQTALAEQEQIARAETQAGNAIYDSAFNLDFKNPHRQDESLGNLDKLLPDYEKLLRSIAETREALKKELEEALSATTSPNR